MSTVAALLALVLAGLAILHLYWGFGGVWPGTDEKSCARAIVGARGVERMPGFLPSVAVAVALLVVAIGHDQVVGAILRGDVLGTVTERDAQSGSGVGQAEVHPRRGDHLRVDLHDSHLRLGPVAMQELGDGSGAQAHLQHTPRPLGAAEEQRRHELARVFELERPGARDAHRALHPRRAEVQEPDAALLADGDQAG